MSSEQIHQYYNKIAKIYDEDRFENSYGKYIHQQETAFLNKNLKGNSILSLACGTGRFMEFAHIGVDVSEEMIQVAQEKFPSKKFENCDASKTNFQNEEFDSIFSFHLFMHLEKSKALEIFEEANRILAQKGQFIFDFPSAKRRKILKRKADNWHASTSYSIEEIKKSLDSNWKLIHYAGVLFFPIHRFPKKLRPFFIRLDNLLCKSFFKEYASYLIVVFEKK
ncbi:MAG: class I SAM-dependent DNA methyltransferase [Flavobacteriia bacterium]|jgi:ubiquinone/menaquinone biosynthesis C-methylase UbiE